MKNIYVKFDTVEQVLAFITILDQYDGVCSLKLDHYYASAKSVLGIFGMDLSKPLLFECGGDLNIIKKITPFILDESSGACTGRERNEKDGIRCSCIGRIINRFYWKWNERTGQSDYGS